MKKLIIYSLVMSMFVCLSQKSFAQQDSVKTTLTKEDYLRKSKKQKTAAWIFTGAGVAISLISLADITASGFNYDPDRSENDGTVSSFISLASIGTGVYLFIASGKNKRRAKAASVFIDMETMPVLQQTVIRQNSYPALGVRIKL